MAVIQAQGRSVNSLRQEALPLVSSRPAQILQHQETFLELCHWSQSPDLQEGGDKNQIQARMFSVDKLQQSSVDTVQHTTSPRMVQLMVTAWEMLRLNWFMSHRSLCRD